MAPVGVDSGGDGTDELPPWADRRRLGSDPHDFAGLYIRSWSHLAAVARRNCRSEADVEEIVQEAFLRMFLALPELEHEDQLLAYARRTVINISIDRQRATGRRPLMVSLDAVPVERLGASEDDDTVVAAEDAAIVRDALARLSPLHRAALVKREIEEKDLAQIGAELEIPDEQVKHLLYRARRALRRLLTGTGVDPASDGDDADAANPSGLAGAGRRGLAVLLIVTLAGVGAVVARQAGAGHSGHDTTAPARPRVSVGIRPSAAAPTGPGGSAVLAVPTAGGRRAAAGIRRGVLPTPGAGTGPASAAAPPVAATPSSASTTPSAPAVGVSRPPVAQPTAPTRQIPPAPGAGATAPYTLKGVVAATGPVTVVSAPTVLQGNATRATSVFQAPVTAGSITLTQAVTQLPDGTTYVEIDPTLVQNGQTTSLAPASTLATLSITPSVVSLDVTVVAQSQVAVSTGPGTSVAVGGLDVDLQLSPDLATVTEEHLMLQPVVTSPSAPGTPTPSVNPDDSHRTPSRASLVTESEARGPLLTANGTPQKLPQV